jgi:hypothetical protein
MESVSMMFVFSADFAGRDFKNQLPGLALFIGKLIPIGWRLGMHGPRAWRNGPSCFPKESPAGNYMASESFRPMQDGGISGLNSAMRLARERWRPG